MYEKLEFCPSCTENKFENKLIAKDYLVSQESFAIVQCKACELLFTNPKPNDSRLAYYYNSDQYISHNNNKKNIQNLIYQIIRSITVRQKIKLIKKYCNTGKLLDFGSGTGTFLKEAIKHFNITGIELNSKAIQQTASLIKKHTYEHIGLLSSNDKFDIITMWHVLEHLPNLKNTIGKIKEHLSPKGHIFIALPNPESWDSNYYGANWAGYDVPRHLYHFNQKAMFNFLKKCELNVIDVKPMKFDAYYISILTERYLNNPYYFIKGLSIGYRSNQFAHVNGQYSSLLYIVNK